MTHSGVRCLLESSDGFIWIGTEEGLNRFDGVEFKQFQKVVNEVVFCQEHLKTFQINGFCVFPIGFDDQSFSHFNPDIKVETRALTWALFTAISPPRRSTMFRTIARPSPVPPYSRVVDELACVNDSKMLFSLSSGMPIPVSITSNRIITFSCCCSIKLSLEVTLPWWVISRHCSIG